MKRVYFNLIDRMPNSGKGGKINHSVNIEI